MAFKDLPTFYYHTHFSEFLDFVRGPCAGLLNQEHREFLSAYARLTQSQQCLLIRLINRKYTAIKTSTLEFVELPNLIDDLDVLFSAQMVKAPESKHAPDLLSVLTKPELAQLYAECGSINAPPILKSANKARYVDACSSLNPADIAVSKVCSAYLVRNVDNYIDYFLFLYFGHGRGTLNQFSMRDLGIMKTRDDQAQMQSRFLDYESAYSCFCLLRCYQEVKLEVFEDAAQVQECVANLPQPVGPQATERYASVLYSLAKKMLPFDSGAAVKMIEDIDDPLLLEFWCRQAYKLDLKNAVEQKLNQIIDDPLTDRLLNFAEDFLARKYQKKRTSVMTDMLRENNRHLSLDESFKGSVEHAVIAYYHARGIKAWRTENSIWNNLFGLCFWPELFELEGLGLATPFDSLPACLKHHQFYEVAGKEIDLRLSNLTSNKQLFLQLTKQAAKHFGKSQGIINWHTSMLDKIKVLVEHAPLDGLKAQLLSMCKNWRLYHDGYPDIMVLEPSSISGSTQLRFEEIKAQGDSIRRNQLMQIQSLKRAGFDVCVTTVDWTVDPHQPYAVIDIETTGGRAGTHKITEIGIVKMIGSEVVDQWQSLINPQRRIPAMITQLTGISNDMVADAPLFADIADELDAFTENCIFVAHNVNFDYGFIREEFAQIDRYFKRPKLCTVQQMRKYFKGLPSYSLANLTKHFDIDMQRHHRALSDARAASELLKLINQFRLSTVSSPLATGRLGSRIHSLQEPG